MISSWFLGRPVVVVFFPLYSGWLYPSPISRVCFKALSLSFRGYHCSGAKRRLCSFFCVPVIISWILFCIETDFDTPTQSVSW